MDAKIPREQIVYFRDHRAYFWARLRSSRATLAALLCLWGMFACKFHNSREQEAIAQAVRYLDQKRDRLLPMVIPNLDFLIRSHSLKIDISEQKRRHIREANATQRVFLRSMVPEKIASPAELRELRGINLVVAQALYCDLYPLPADYEASIHRLMAAGRYSLTHAVLATLMIVDKKCKMAGTDLSELIERQRAGLLSLLNKIDPASDLGIEAIVMLYSMRHVGAQNAVSPEGYQKWIEAILRAQQPNGSWNQDDHTTVLAIWALLEAMHSQ
jgi:hypothetical protein